MDQNQPDQKPRPIRGPDPHTPEWLEKHNATGADAVFGASDAARLCAKSEYGTPHGLCLEKMGRVAPFEGNKNTQRGNRYELPIGLDYADEMGLTLVHPLPMFTHPTIPYLVATPDALARTKPVVVDGKVQVTSRMVEIKWSTSRARAAELGEEHTDWIPDDWMLQGQQQMDVLQCEEVDFAILLFGKLKIYTVKRSDDLIGFIHSAAAEMRERILNDDPPEPNWTHPRDQELIKTLYGLEGPTKELSDEANVAWEVAVALKAEIKELEGSLDASLTKVRHAMGEAAIARLPGGQRELVRKRISVKESLHVAHEYTRGPWERKVK